MCYRYNRVMVDNLRYSAVFLCCAQARGGSNAVTAADLRPRSRGAFVLMLMATHPELLWRIAYHENISNGELIIVTTVLV